MFLSLKNESFKCGWMHGWMGQDGLFAAGVGAYLDDDRILRFKLAELDDALLLDVVDHVARLLAASVSKCEQV
eukprot:363235-Chlamydomonas_euryale.AAC.2